MFTRRSPRVRELRLYDVANTAGVAADLSHIATAPRITAHTGPAQLGDALYGADLVVIPAGVPRKPGMTRDDLFNINAGEGCVRGVCGGCGVVAGGEREAGESGYNCLQKTAEDACPVLCSVMLVNDTHTRSILLRLRNPPCLYLSFCAGGTVEMHLITARLPVFWKQREMRFYPVGG